VAVGLSDPQNLLPVRGVRLAAGACGLKASGAEDLMVMVADAGTQTAAVFTQNVYCAAPVTVAKEHLACATPVALIVNSGNANAGTGKQGEEDARSMCRRVAQHLDVSGDHVLPFSTGVISEPLPIDKVNAGVDLLVGQLAEHSWLDAARAIMTTDTIPKGVSVQCHIDGEPITITGIAKGSGMIHPNMATMLSFVATDAAIDPYSLQELVKTVSDNSFNSVTVDGDTSTNDAFVVMATGVAVHRLLSPSHPEWHVFVDALQSVALHLAHAIVRDGEGATRFIEILVSGGASIGACKQVGFTVAHSPLVKTAFFAGDPNLGRILAAVGRSQVEELDMQFVSMSIGDLSVVEHGEPSADYDEARAAEIMALEDVTIQIDLGMGEHTAAVWTTDLSYDYVKINAEYRS